MRKEIWICIVIIIIIVVSNYITQNYTNATAEDLNNKLQDLKTELINISENKEEESKKIEYEETKNETKKITEEQKELITSKIEEIDKIWEEKNDKLAYYIEHTELEKVDNNLVTLKSLIESKNYDEALKETDETAFAIKHLEEKYAFNFKNIF